MYSSTDPPIHVKWAHPPTHTRKVNMQRVPEWLPLSQAALQDISEKLEQADVAQDKTRQLQLLHLEQCSSVLT